MSPEFAQIDAKLGRIYVNIEDRNMIRAIDTKTHAVVASWPLSPGEEPTGLAFDPTTRRLFATCDKTLVVLNPDTGKVVTTLATGEGVDAVAFDPATKFVFASASDGTMTIAHVDSADKLSLVQTLKTPLRGRTMTIDPKTHNLFVASAQFEAAPPPTAATPRPRPKMVPGTFHVAVFAMKAGS
jgi:DNA-binding beta-propeller fold protein YncE